MRLDELVDVGAALNKRVEVIGIVDGPAVGGGIPGTLIALERVDGVAVRAKIQMDGQPSWCTMVVPRGAFCFVEVLG